MSYHSEWWKEEEKKIYIRRSFLSPLYILSTLHSYISLSVLIYFFMILVFLSQFCLFFANNNIINELNWCVCVLKMKWIFFVFFFLLFFLCVFLVINVTYSVSLTSKSNDRIRMWYRYRQFFVVVVLMPLKVSFRFSLVSYFEGLLISRNKMLVDEEISFKMPSHNPIEWIAKIQIDHLRCVKHCVSSFISCSFQYPLIVYQIPFIRPSEIFIQTTASRIITVV